ncbi:MAG: hypothetical protein H0U87_12355 [Acidobacteria bacterium]|nr:hypothetical protein [Acidobacteriota bacterium]
MFRETVAVADEPPVQVRRGRVLYASENVLKLRSLKSAAAAKNAFTRSLDCL